MKITKIRPIVCHCYRTNWVFVKVETDAGIEGVGEATLEYREPTLVQAIKEMERNLIGRDPHEIEAIWHECYRETYFRGGPINMSALAGIEMALWDIKGKEAMGSDIADAILIYGI